MSTGTINTVDLFADVVKAGLEEAHPECCVMVHKVTKNNNLVLTGISIRSKEVNLAPTIYMDGYDKELLDGIYDLILETVLCKSGNVIIASNEYPVQLVKSKFLKLNSSHIQYVMDCLKETTSKVRNIKKYLLAALFNAPSTMKSYYQAEVNHDMPQFAVRAI